MYQLKAKISDVGLAQMIEGCSESTSKSMIFMAPEMTNMSKSVNDINPDPSADVFSYGVVMLHTVTQQWPEPTSICQKREQSTVDGLNNLMGSCLEETPRNRPIVTDVLTKLKAFITSPSVSKVLEQV